MPLLTEPGSVLAYSIEGFATASGLGRTRLYDAIKAGHLRARKYGNRTVILVEDGREFLSALPVVKNVGKVSERSSK